MEVRLAHELLVGAHPDFGRFYGPADGLDLGVGLILRETAYPYYDDQEAEFGVAQGRVYILSHECDIDQANNRPLNTQALICPIIPLEILLEKYLSTRSNEQAQAFIDALGKRAIDRVAYIPTIADDLPYGGVLYFSSITHTHINELSRPEVSRCCSLSAFGLRYIDAALHQALLKRPKAQALPLSGDLIRWLGQADIEGAP